MNGWRLSPLMILRPLPPLLLLLLLTNNETLSYDC